MLSSDSHIFTIYLLGLQFSVQIACLLEVVRSLLTEIKTKLQLLLCGFSDS